MICEFCKKDSAKRFCDATCARRYSLGFVDRRKAGITNHERYSYKITSSDEAVRETFRNELTLTGTLRRLGHKTHAGARKSLRELLISLGEDVSAIGKTKFQKNGELNLDEIFKKHDRRVNSPLVKALQSKGVSYECSWCGLGNVWNGKAITLQIDHVNGDNTDDRFENLRFLCPNCHSQTSTWCSKNRKKNER